MNFELAKSKVINYIGISKKTENEVISKLKLIGADEKVISDVISYLNEAGYINDKDYTDAYIRQCMRLLKYSIYEIRQKLLQKGIKRDIIETSLENIDANNYENNVMSKIIKSKIKSMDEQKINQYLYRRGFKNYSYEE